MANEIIVSDRGQLIEHQPSRLAVAGQQANHAAANHATADYLSRKAKNTIRTQAAALSLFADYLDDVGELGAALHQYADDVATWATGEKEAVKAPDPAAWQGVTWGIVEGFVKWLLGQGYAVGSVNNRLSAIKVHAKLAAKAGYIDRIELLGIKDVNGYSGKEAKRIDERRDVTRVGDKKEEHVSLTPEEAKKLKGMMTHEGAQGARDRLLMCLLLDHGLRVSEVAGLQVTDFNLSDGTLSFYRPKVDKEQTHKMEPDTLRAAIGYLVHYAPAMGRAIVGSRKGGELTGRPMSKRAITKRVRYLGETMIGKENLSAHDCRHYWATDAARNGTDPFRLQEAGGWSSLAMPRRYVEDARIANEGVKLSK